MWQIVNNVDIDSAKKLPLFARTPFLEAEGIVRTPLVGEAINLKSLFQQNFLGQRLKRTYKLLEN